MKKIVSLVLVIALCCAALAAFAEESYAGVWTLSRATWEGDGQKLEFTAEQLAASNLTMTMDLKEDGTFVSSETTAETSQTLEGTWEFKDGSLILTFDAGVTQVIPIIDGEMMIDDTSSGTKLYLTRQAGEAADAA